MATKKITTFTLKNGNLAGVVVVASEPNNPKVYVAKTVAQKAADKLTANGHNVRVVTSVISLKHYIEVL